MKLNYCDTAKDYLKFLKDINCTATVLRIPSKIIPKIRKMKMIKITMNYK